MYTSFCIEIELARFEFTRLRSASSVPCSDFMFHKNAVFAVAFMTLVGMIALMAFSSASINHSNNVIRA